MADDIDAQLATSIRREAALARVLRAVADRGADVESVLYEIALQASVLTGAKLGYVFIAEGRGLPDDFDDALRGLLTEAYNATEAR